MRYLSVCSGIEAATVAWHPLGWTPVGYCEIEAFPSAVLAHHWPSVPNYGDFTRLIDAAHPVHQSGVELLVGGTPCQAFSVAGLRRGLADARGGLTLEFVKLAAALRPRWIVWENVPGVLSQDGGRAFGAFLGALVELGYGFAYRVLDAQYFGVAQRRRRVFVVACAGGRAERAAAVLFEPEGVRGHTPPSREAGQRAATTLAARTRGGGGLGTDFDLDGGLIRHDGGRGGVAYGFNFEQFSGTEGPISPCLTKTEHKGKTLVYDGPHVVAPPLCMAHGQGGAEIRVDGAPSLTCNHEAPIVFDTTQITSPLNRSAPKPGDPCHPLAAGAHAPAIAKETHVRRLTPTECERLQGFPDGHTAVPYRGKSAADGPRYKALGNSMAVPVMRWIGERIAKVEQL